VGLSKIIGKLLIRDCAALMATNRVDSTLQPPPPAPYTLSLTKFPLEIITRVFEILVELPAPEAYGNVTYVPPLRLGRICREWREIAWSLPTLWSDVRVIIPSSRDEEQDENRLKILRGWLERGRQTLMSVEVLETDMAARESTAQVLDLLRPTSARWQSLNIYAGYPEDLRFDTLQLPFLRRLAMQSTAYGEAEVTTLEFDSSTFRSVETLLLSRIPTIKISSTYSLTDIGQNITHIALTDIAVDAVINLLTYSRHTLVSCRLHYIYLPIEWAWDAPQHHRGWRPETVIVLPHLVTLHLHQLRVPLRSVLACLQTPALKELHLNFGGPETPVHHQLWDESILGLLTGPKTLETLEHLVLESHSLPVDVFTQIVLVCKGLKRMSVYVRNASATVILGTLLGVEESTHFLLRMEYLEYLNWEDRMHDEIILGAVKSRWRCPEAALRGVRFKHSDRDIVSRVLKTEIEEGLDVKFGFGYDD